MALSVKSQSCGRAPSNTKARGVYWALQMWLVWLQNGIFNMDVILMQISLHLNLKTDIQCSYWKTFKYVLNNLYMWIY